jgi:superfamily I DNA/RNA helicase
MPGLQHAGKTRVVTARAAWLLAGHDVQPHNLLVITFTKKAAKELRVRQLFARQSSDRHSMHNTTQK